MSPEDIEALAGRVEAGETGSDTEEAISAILGIIPDGDGWWQMVAGYWEKRGAPAYLTSLDGADQVMPWQYDSVSISHEPPGGVTVKAAIWSMGGDPHRSGQVSAFAPTECAARVAAGLRAQAHILRKGAK